LVTIGLVEGRPHSPKEIHDDWLVVEQDCGMTRGAAADDHECTIELRPVYDTDPPSDQGIRSAKFSLGNGRYLHSNSPRLLASPAFLASIANPNHQHEDCIDDDHAIALKTWLGRRYDRPAVPAVFTELHYELSKRVRKQKHPHRDRLRDVLVSFAEEDDQTRFDLVGVLPADDIDLTDEDKDSLADWLAELCSDVPVALGVATGFQVLTADVVSLDFIERSYALDVSYVSWPSNGDGPIGSI
jgi:hypothetical protein